MPWRFYISNQYPDNFIESDSYFFIHDFPLGLTYHVHIIPSTTECWMGTQWGWTNLSTEPANMAAKWASRKLEPQVSIMTDFFVFVKYLFWSPFILHVLHTFISNARLKFANFQNLSRKILRTELWNLCQTIAFFPNSILNTFLSGRVRPILWNFGFR